MTVPYEDTARRMLSVIGTTAETIATPPSK